MPLPTRSTSFLVAALLIAMSACGLPDGDQTSPTQVHYLWVKVRAAGETPAMWELLHPEVRAEFEAWHAAERALVQEIKASYPAEDMKSALAAIGGSERAELESARDLFARFVTAAPAPASGFGLRVKSEDIAADGASAVVRTHGGDEIVVRKGGEDRWFVTLSSDELVRLKNARGRAEENLKRVRANLAKLKRNKP